MISDDTKTFEDAVVSVRDRYHSAFEELHEWLMARRQEE
jgi:hypothetical protein